jgi:diguanylate cyclase (GGDEF)-like protein/PAS domain S-box-containing protein
MGFIDSKTIFFVYIVTSIISSVVQLSLWRENRQRFPEIKLWFVDTVLQTMGLFFILLRGAIPDFFSIILANGFIITGTICLFVGLELFVGRKPKLLPHFLLLGGFLSLHLWFTYAMPNLAIRNINSSLALVLLTLRIGFTLLFRIDKEMRKITRATAVVILAHCLASFLHILSNLSKTRENDLFNLGTSNASFILSYMIIYLSLTFTLVLMVTNRTKQELQQSENKFFTVFKTAPYALSLTSLKEGTLIAFNDAFISLSGYSSSELEGKSTLDLNIWTSESERENMLTCIEKGLQIKNKEIQFRPKGEKLLTCLLSTEFLYLNDIPCLLSSTTDISERIAMESELRQNRTFLSDIIEHSGNLICAKEKDGTYKLVNTKWEQITGLGRNEVLGKTDLEVFPGSVGQEFHDNDQEAMLNDGDTEHEESLDTPSGKKYFLSIKFPLHDKTGDISGICAMISDITDRKQTEDQIEYLANHDHLTGLPTMRLAKKKLSLALKHTHDTQKEGALLYLDLDGFKRVNDTIGHDAGDFVLKEIGKRLKTCNTDKYTTVARIGGDEFLIILTEIESTTSVVNLSNLLLVEVNKPILIGTTSFEISTSIGIVFFPGKDTNLDSIIKRADEAMYESKKKGKNSWTMKV